MNKNPSLADIEAAANILRIGGLAVFPTESSYGLGGKFNDAQVIKRILKIKGRKDEKFTLIASCREQVLQFFTLSNCALKLADTYWPGPLSIVVSNQFSIRVPKLPRIQHLADLVGTPLIATSANKSGHSPAFTLQSAKNELGELHIDVWLDGGELIKKDPSTVVECKGNQLIIHRHGAITL